MKTRPGIPIANSNLEVVVTDDGSRTLRKRGTQTTWHSESGALAESELVFIRNSGVEGLCQAGEPQRILEVGFGTGLNFWLASSRAIEADIDLDFVSLEIDLLRWECIQHLAHGKLKRCQPAFDIFAERIFDSKSSTSSERTTPLDVMVSDQGITLKISSQLPESHQASSFDAVFHDPFSPEDAPEFWSEELFGKLKKLLRPNGRLVTYCVKSAVQRTLKQVGFDIEKTPGPVGGKREVLIAHNVV